MKTGTHKIRCFAEVIASSLTGWEAQSWQWDSFPEFGSLVTVETKKRTLFGIVHNITTGSMEPGRYPFAYQKTEQELLEEQPQIFEFLKTVFSCLTVGFEEYEQISYRLAPEPAKIHAFVGPASDDQYRRFFANPDYLHVILASTNLTCTDELLLALFSSMRKQALITPEKTEQFFEIFLLLTGNDYHRLKRFIGRIYS